MGNPGVSHLGGGGGLLAGAGLPAASMIRPSARPSGGPPSALGGDPV
jgi:hypothetical protein